MFKSARVYLAFALVTAANVATVCCSGATHTAGTGGEGGSTSTTSTTTTTTATTTTTTTTTTQVVCPTPPNTVLAVSQLYFGDGTSGQWKSFGFNLDNLVSTAASTNVCMLNAGAAASAAYPDGNNGIDNSFGKNLLPVILGIDPNWVTSVNNSIQMGDFTVLLEMDCLPAMGNVSGMTTKLFGAETLGTVPKWDGTDMWPVEPDLLNNPNDPESSSIVFNQCSVTGNTFSAGTNGTFVLTIPLIYNGISTSIKLTLYAAQLTMSLAADRKSAAGGMLGGVLNTEEFVAEVNNVAYVLGICNTSALTNLVTLVRQASDIMADGTQDPTKVCNGISVGLGFDMKPAQVGTVGPPVPSPTPCGGNPDAGDGG